MRDQTFLLLRYDILVVAANGENGYNSFLAFQHLLDFAYIQLTTGEIMLMNDTTLTEWVRVSQPLH
jgi:hypothetical protein